MHLLHPTGEITGWFVGRLVFNGTFSTNRPYRAIEVWNILCRAGQQGKHTIKQRNNT